MRRWLDALEQFAVDVILERRSGRRAYILRVLLLAVSALYFLIVQTRLFLYRSRIFRESAPGCTVISIGNLTVGGTGKTPVVEMLARALTERGRRVAILSRGYKSRPRPLIARLFDRIFKKKNMFTPRIVSDGRALLLDSRVAGDEPFMLANNLRGVPVLVDKDRVKSGLYAIDHFDSDTLLLDDGYQYLRLKRRINIALVDRQAPFGNGFLLPRGTLREPAANLRRAHYILITKCSDESNDSLIRLIRRYNKTADIIECTHRPIYLREIYTGETRPLDFLKGLRVASLCGIAAPESFEQALRELGANLEITRAFADHHRFSRSEIRPFIRRCVQRRIPAIITTEKDAVRFPRLTDVDVPIYFLRVEIEILRGHAQWKRLLDRICHPDEPRTLLPLAA